MLEDFQSLESSVREQGGPHGLLRISAPVSFGTAELTPALLEFAAAYPDVSLDVSSTDRMVNLVEEGFDVAVRIGQLDDSSLVARKLAAGAAGDLRLARLPGAGRDAGDGRRPGRPRGDHRHQHSRSGALVVRRQRGDAGGAGRRAAALLRAQACVAAARAGFGVTRTPAFAAAEDLRAGRLTALLCGFEPRPIHVHAAYPHARHLAPKVRAFVDFLAKRYAGEPEWHKGWR